MEGLNEIFILRIESLHLKSGCQCKLYLVKDSEIVEDLEGDGVREFQKLLYLYRNPHLCPWLYRVSIISTFTATADSNTATLPATAT